MAQTSYKLITIENFLQLPETKPASEYIHGEIIQKPMPQGKHSIIQTILSATINEALMSNRLVGHFQSYAVVLMTDL